MKVHYEETAIGSIGIAEEDGSITHLWFATESPPVDAERCETPLLKEAFNQLRAYLTGERREFTLPLAPVGTAFMRRAWQELCRIPYGSTASYQQLAAAAGSPKGARAAGMVCNRNPLPIFIPCHRVIGADGKLTGYVGGLDLKEKLLALERSGLSAHK